MSGTAAVVLAAGGGTRFAGPQHKLLTPVAGRPMVAQVVAHVLNSGVAPVLVVAGAVDLGQVLPPGVDVVTNPRWAEGMATSLAAAVAWARAEGYDAMVVGLGDQPGVTADAWRAVATAIHTPIAVATYGGRRGHPVRLASAVWDDLPTTGDRGARDVMAGSPGLVTEVACAGDPADVDTVEDLNRWR